MGRAIVRGKRGYGRSNGTGYLNELQRRERAEVLTKLGFQTYAKYLRSPLWLGIRERVLAEKPLCRRCSKPATQVHHSSYDMATLSGAVFTHLHSVCGGCHRASGHCGGVARRPKKLSAKAKKRRKRSTPFRH